MVAFMSSKVKNAAQLINLDGIISPVLKEMGVKLEILTDDMANSEDLMIENEAGEKQLFVEPFDASSAIQLFGSLLFFSTMTLAILQ